MRGSIAAALVCLTWFAVVARADEPVAAEPPAPEPSVSPADPSPCLRPPVNIRRRHIEDAIRIALTTCDGAPNLAVLDELSALARPRTTPRPTREAMEAYREAHPDHTSWLVQGSRRLHEGLLVRLQALADRWPDRGIEINSGYRPNARRGSRHRTGRALDLSVDGVHREEVAAFARSFADTGVGYYPRSTFTHIDVRDASYHWVDRSGPGEPPDYGPWPASDAEQDETRNVVLASIDAALADLADSPFATDAPAPSPASSESTPAPDAAYTRAVRDEALAAIERAARAPVQVRPPPTPAPVTYTQVHEDTPPSWDPPW